MWRAWGIIVHGTAIFPTPLYLTMYDEDPLESFAWCEVKRKVVSRYGYIQMFGRMAYVGRAWRERELTFVETLEGLEAHTGGRCVAVLRDYWKYRKLQSWEWSTIPPRLYFRPYERASCPRMAVA